MKSGNKKENKQTSLAGLFNGSLLFTSKTSYFILANNEYLVKNSHVYKIKADATDFLGRTLGQRNPNLNLISIVSVSRHSTIAKQFAIKHFLLPLFLVFTMLCWLVTDFVYCRMAMAFGLFHQNLAQMFFGPRWAWLHLCFSLGAPSFAPTHTTSHKYSSRYSRVLKMTVWTEGMFVWRNSDW